MGMSVWNSGSFSGFGAEVGFLGTTHYLMYKLDYLSFLGIYKNFREFSSWFWLYGSYFILR